MVMSFFRRRDDSGIDRIEAQVQLMVTDARHTFDLAMNALTGGSVASVGEEVRRTDRRINVTEMEIRRELVVHFSVHAAGDATEMLVFMNMIKDLERIGDYNKNVFDLAEEGVSFLDADDLDRILGFRDEISSRIALMGEILTARDAEADKIQGLGLGADDYITKPFSMRELRARVTSALRRDQLSREAGAEQRVEGDTLEGGGILIDLIAHEVTVRGEPVTLRPREFELLEYLMRHPGQALSREMILESVWGYSYGGETRTVDVHVRWVREKVEVDPAQPEHIQTVRSVGYKFVA